MKHTYARNPHELARVLEDESRIAVSEIFLYASLEKLKSEKSELPEGTYMFNRLEGDGKVVSTYKEPKYWLKAPYSDSYLENYENCRAKEGE